MRHFLQNMGCFRWTKGPREVHGYILQTNHVTIIYMLIMSVICLWQTPSNVVEGRIGLGLSPWFSISHFVFVGTTISHDCSVLILYYLELGIFEQNMLILSFMGYVIN